LRPGGCFSLAQRTGEDWMVGRDGFEPSTSGLKGRRSLLQLQTLAATILYEAWPARRPSAMS
jgi:hypothetical protein